MCKEDYVADDVDSYRYRKTTLNRVIAALPFIEKHLASSGGIFALSDSNTEKLLNIEFTQGLKTYYELHYLFRKLNIEFMWMKTTHKCGFMKLSMVNKILVVEI